LDNKALAPVKSEIDFNEFTNQLVDRIKKRFPTAQIKKDLNSNLKIQADEFMLETILLNLLENAIKYAGTSEEIGVFGKIENDKFIFGVSDFGPGISADDKQSIFSKFYRSGNEETRQNKGSGLGLYIVSQFVQLHQGTIVCKNNSPKGSIFEVTLPL
jgi:K+-sensing histidine kinase KdpD